MKGGCFGKFGHPDWALNSIWNVLGFEDVWTKTKGIACTKRIRVSISRTIPLRGVLVRPLAVSRLTGRDG